MLSHAPPLLRLPGMVQAQVYCAAPAMTPEFAERIATLVEQITGCVFSHAIRDVFPAPRKRSISAEAEAAWKSPRGRFRLSNALADAQHLQLMAGVLPRRTDMGREHYGYVTLAIRAAAAAATAVANDLARLVQACDAVYARADAPTWGIETGHPAAFGTVDLDVAPGWRLTERLGWTTFLPQYALRALGTERLRALAALGVRIAEVASGAVLRLSDAPIRDGDPAHLALHAAVLDVLRFGARRQSVDNPVTQG